METGSGGDAGGPGGGEVDGHVLSLAWHRGSLCAGTNNGLLQV
jgi:hypothetical protein